MLKKPHYIAFGFVLVGALILVNLPTRWAAQLKTAVSALFLPIIGLSGSVESGAEAAGGRLLPRGMLQKENERLRRENEQLKIQAMQLQELWRENNRLHDALTWQRGAPWQMKLARVVMRDPANWWRTAIIDLGSEAGVVTNLAVVTAEGLVGRVDQVSSGTSRIVLIGDPNCRVAAVVDNRQRPSGVILPGDATVLDESLVELTYLPANSEVVPGQKVVTSGMGGIFPKGIPIGQIINTNSVQFGLHLEAQVKLSADLRNLEYVWIVFK